MSEKLLGYLQTTGLAAPLSASEANEFAAELDEISDQQVYPRSITIADNALYFLARNGDRKSLGVIAADPKLHRKFDGESAEIFVGNQALQTTLAETSAANAAALRAMLPFLAPVTLGLKKSAGCGDRLGLATPGHIRAIRH